MTKNRDGIKALHTCTKLKGLHKDVNSKRQGNKGSSKSGPAQKKT